MNLDYFALQEIFSSWPNVDIPDQTVQDSLVERIRQILQLAKRSSTAVPFSSDMPPLLRHYLLRESSRAGQSMKLRVPMSGGWPKLAAWDNHGISALAAGEHALILTAEPWHPSWLGSVDQAGVFADAFTEFVVREDGRCSADPFVADATGYNQYSCPGQREAVRAAFLMRPGHTLIVNLPTGSGKSLVGQLPALVHTQHGNLTLFVVPTVALAIDQERQMAEYFRKGQTGVTTWPLAWHGGLSPEGRAEVRRRMHEGTQRILFTSPEALTTSLLRTVFEVSQAGMLKYLVIDEAHLVTQWGDDFRPAFQAIAGLRNGLLRHASNGFRTLLLSATFTAETVDILANLFGPPEKVQMVSAVHLRPEPQYWFYRASSRAEKLERVLEALRHAPRPFILYVTKREDALWWRQILQTQAGLNRIARFDGTTPDQQREQIITDWANNRLDGIVATSAFGVGIDKGDVRTIIHATIPETLDRFYQEVGRGGRDGRPSVSLLVFDDTDWALPKRLSTPSLISDELGINRWKAIYASRNARSDDGLFPINLDAVPIHRHGGNEYNVGWNMRTLLLMSRAGLLELDIENNNELVDAVEEFSPSSPLVAMAKVRIHILNSGHQLPEVWERAIGPTRATTYHSAARNLNLMSGLLQGHREVASTFAELYRIRSLRWSVDVTRVCGGCPSDRFVGVARAGYHVPVAAAIQDIDSVNLSCWRTLFPWLDPAWVLIFYDDGMSPTVIQQAILKFVSWLVGECGVQEVAADPRAPLVQLPAWKKLYRCTRDSVLIHRNLDQLDQEPYAPLARVTVLDTNVTGHELERISLLQRPYHLVLLPKSTRDPDNEQRLLVDTAASAAQLEQLLGVLSQ